MKRFTLFYSSIVLVILSITACGSSSHSDNIIDPDPTDPVSETTTVTYTPTSENFANPERGFYVQYDTDGTGTLSLSKLKSLRSNEKCMSLIMRMYYLKGFRNSALSDDVLAHITNDLSVVRQAGLKAVLRFAYTNSQKEADAPMAIVLQHLDQLKPIFEANKDVIAVVQAGFIGAWGEWYYSTNGLNNDASRKQVLDKLLSVLPSERCIQVRTPDYKRTFTGVSTALTQTKAYSNTGEGRIGHHNDCFLASATDYGTYSDVTLDKNYLNQEGLYVPIGGETCPPDGVDPADCTKAQTELRNLRWSFLNSGYYEVVLNNWVLGGCMDDIISNLGYRVYAQKAVFSKKHIPGSDLYVKLNMQNVGYAPMFNPRNVELVLRSTDGKTQYVAKLPDDPRTWQPNKLATIEEKIALPSDIVAGNYNLYLFLPDPETTIHDRPEYAVRLANASMWEESTGYNNLNQIITVDASGSLSKSTSSIKFIKK